MSLFEYVVEVQFLARRVNLSISLGNMSAVSTLTPTATRMGKDFYRVSRIVHSLLGGEYLQM
jgi:hypothetical protein